ncbi:hypothetical protein JCM3774_005686 [Rhodotorula dairenensis]
MALSLDQEPSFDLSRAQTSTPNRAAAALRTRHAAGRRGEVGDDEDEGAEPLHESDTDSIAGEGHEHQGELDEPANGGSTPLTRRSLLRLARHDNLDSAAPRDPLPPDIQPALNDRRTLDSLRREHLFAPSPSTGSSTLVDREYEPHLFASKTRYAERNDPGFPRASPPRLSEGVGPLRQTMEGIVERDGQPSEDESIASQQLRRGRIGDLASFVDSRLSDRRETIPATPRRQSARRLSSSRSRNVGPPPPPAVSTPRQADYARSGPDSASLGYGDRTGTSPNSIGSTQVHDVFKRLITGPDGALAHSAERRSAAAAAAAVSSTRLSASYDRYEPPTPAPPGHYSFVPSSSLPVQRDSPRRTSREQTHATQDELPSEVQRYEDVQREAKQPSQLERALHHLSEAQRLSAGLDLPLEADVDRRRAADDLAYQTSSRTRVAHEARGGRSAIDFAMAESSAFSHSEDDEVVPDLHVNLRNSVRFAAEPTYRTRSPSRSLSPPSRAPSPPQVSSANQSTFAGPGAFPRSLSPDLPPLPLPLPPESPEANRVAPKTRSPSSRFRRSQSSPPEQPQLVPVQQHEQPIPPVSPPRPNRRPGWQRPASSTPPRPEVEAPRPQGTPENRPDLSLSRTARASTTPPDSWQDSPEPEITPLRFEPRAAEAGGIAAADESATSVKIQELVSQLSAAVKTLADREPPLLPPSRDEPVHQPATREEELRSELERRRLASDQNRETLNHELVGIETKTAATLGDRSETMQRLLDTYELEHELGCRMEELKRSIEGMGQLVGDQVAEAVGQTLERESQSRARWLAIACGAQIAVFLFILRLVNAQHANMYASVYYDPFHPDLFHLPPGVSPYDMRHDPYLSLDTLSAFAPPGTVRSAPSTFGVSLLAVKALLHRWVLPLLPKLRLSSGMAERPAVVPI